jgi:hypothetical protein
LVEVDEMNRTKIRGKWLRLLVRVRRQWRLFQRNWKKTSSPAPNVARRRLRQHAMADTWA